MIFVNVHEGLLKDGSSLTSLVFEANLWRNSEDWESSCFMALTLEKIWRNDRVLRAWWCTRVLIASLCTRALRIIATDRILLSWLSTGDISELCWALLSGVLWVSTWCTRLNYSTRLEELRLLLSSPSVEFCKTMCGCVEEHQLVIFLDGTIIRFFRLFHCCCSEQTCWIWEFAVLGALPVCVHYFWPPFACGSVGFCVHQAKIRSEIAKLEQEERLREQSQSGSSGETFISD